MEGRREIEAAKLRVATANRMMEAAQALMETARKELEDAFAFLNDTEERLEVIDVDDHKDMVSGCDSQGSKKRRKLFMSPSGSNRVLVNNGNVPGDAIGVVSGRQNATNRYEGGQMQNGPRGSAISAIAAPSADASSGSDIRSSGSREGAQEGAPAAAVGTRATASISINGTSALEKPTEVHQNSPAPKNLHNFLLLKRGEANFQAAIDKHRDESLILMKQSAARGESSVPMSKMAACRLKNIGLMRAANLSVVPAGGKKKTENKLTERMIQAENAAKQLYVKEKAEKSRKNKAQQPVQSNPFLNRDNAHSTIVSDLLRRCGGKQKTESELTAIMTESEIAAAQFLEEMFPNHRAQSKSNSGRDNAQSSNGPNATDNTVSGGGLPGVNGRYSRSLTELRDGIPTYMNKEKRKRKSDFFPDTR